MTNQKNSSTEWLTLSQASKMLGVHSATLREWSDKAASTATASAKA